jgi:serine/threonine protein kinase
MAPEILENEMYDLTCDVWSLGVTIYELVEGRKLFSSHNIPDLI